MMTKPVFECRYFVSYSGVTLPLRLVSPIDADALSNRNTFIRAFFAENGAMTGFDKLVYGEVELAHRYEYFPDGALSRAVISMLGEDDVVLSFDEIAASTPEPLS
jgi:Family of unknown function (DUF6156)